jgi:tetratricopeptide (TPR) repeat protein
MNARIDNFKALLARGQESALLHYSLGLEYLNIKAYLPAVTHFAKAVELNPNYSAAWKGYGKALAESQQLETAMTIYTQGIAIAEQQRDLQAAKEMRVFLNRVKKQCDK